MDDRVVLDILDDPGRPKEPYPESLRSKSLYLALEIHVTGQVGWWWLVFANKKDWQG